MRRVTGMILAAALSSLLLVSGVFASEDMMERAKSAMQRVGGEKEAVSPFSDQSEIFSAKTLIGMRVENPQGQKIGEVRDLLLDRTSNQIGYVKLASGEVMGMGGSDHLVPFRALTHDQQKNLLILDADKAKVAATPTRSQEMNDQDYARRLHEFYGIAPYWEQDMAPAAQPMQEVPGAEGLIERTLERYSPSK